MRSNSNGCSAIPSQSCSFNITCPITSASKSLRETPRSSERFYSAILRIEASINGSQGSPEFQAQLGRSRAVSRANSSSESRLTAVCARMGVRREQPRGASCFVASGGGGQAAIGLDEAEALLPPGHQLPGRHRRQGVCPEQNLRGGSTLTRSSV